MKRTLTSSQAALVFHPDKVPEGERGDAEIKFKAVSRAYEILYEDAMRARYDRFGMAAFENGGMNGSSPDEMDPDDFLAHMFMYRRGSSQQRQKGRDVVHQYEITLEELYKGKTVKLNSTRNKLCTTCAG